jgi:glycerate dehydrogenase
MKVVILDSYTTNPGDLSWDDLEDVCSLTVHERTPAEKTIERAIDAEAVLTNKAVLDRFVIAGLPKLKYIGLLSTGCNVVDLDAAAERGIVVTNVPAYSTMSVAQLVFAHLLNFTNRIDLHAESVQSGEWCKSRDFCYWKSPLTELAGLTIGIVGCGSIGESVARIASCFAMKVIAHTRTPRTECDKVEFVGLDDVFRRSDVLSLHCPLEKDTEKLVNRDRLNSMKPTAFLINTARGGLLDEEAVADALNTGRIAGAGLDVLSTEPPSPDNPLLTAKNCWISPHIAWATRAARVRLVDQVIKNFKAFTAGKPVNVVSDISDCADQKEQ